MSKLDELYKEWRRRGYVITPAKPEDLGMDYTEAQRMIGAGVPTITVRADEIDMLFESVRLEEREALKKVECDDKYVCCIHKSDLLNELNNEK